MGKLRIVIGNITSDEILDNHDLIINPTNPQMIAGSGVSGTIFKKAGVNELEKYTQETFKINYFYDRYKKENIMKIGEVRITPGFSLNMDIMFVQGPKQWEHENSLELLIDTYKNMLNKIAEKGYKNVLIPSIGTGTCGFKHEDIGKRVKDLLNNFLINKDINIDLVLYKETDKNYYE